MAKSIGIDVSYANGNIDWAKVKPHINFAMIRAGFGSKTVDTFFKQNASACTALKIPFGVYWFSYALNEEMARREAIKCLATIRPYTLSCPVAFDFEYDSIAYAKRQNVNISASKMCSIACAFLDEIKKNGYPVLLYTNPDFWFNMGFKQLGNRYPIWCASWNTEKPAIYCAMWQDSATAHIEGIDGNVDTDVSYVEYSNKIPSAEIDTKVNNVCQQYNEIYVEIARDIIAGEYGNGKERIENLNSKGYDARFAQAIVNALLSHG